MYKYDALTGLNNRMAFISKYEELLKDPSNYGKKVTIFVADLNGLKKINDSFGHLAGDKAIATVAKALKKACPSDAICVRIGGDEMLAFILGDHQCDNVIPDVETILEKESLMLGIRVSASIGTYTAVFEKDMDINKLIAIADAQMYEMKRNRK
jgi:diguanylate cyclase (GGDEF)-like protein